MEAKLTKGVEDDELNQYLLTPKMIEFLKNDILNKVFVNNITYPGNHVKNEEYSGDVSFYNSAVTIVSMYSIAIKVRDKDLLFVAITNGEIELKVFGDYPADNYDDVLAFNRKMGAQIREATKKPRAISKYTLLSSILLFILFLVLGLTLNILALTIISIVILVLGIGIFIKFSIDVKNISKPYRKQIYEYNQNDSNNKKNHKEESYQAFINKK